MSFHTQYLLEQCPLANGVQIFGVVVFNLKGINLVFPTTMMVGNVIVFLHHVTNLVPNVY